MRPGILFRDAFTLSELFHECSLFGFLTIVASIPFLL